MSSYPTCLHIPHVFISQSYLPIYRPKNTHHPFFFGIRDPGSQLYQPIYQGFDGYPKRFLDPSPIYLSTDQKIRTTLFFGIWDPGSQLYQGFDIYPKRFLDPSPKYLSTDQKTRTTLFYLGSGITALS